MALHSFQFLLFVIAAFFGFLLIDRRRQWLWLLMLSGVFTWSAGMGGMSVLSGLIVGGYIVGILIEQAGKSQLRRSLALAAGIGGSLAVLFGFKYLNFFLKVLNDLGGPTSVPMKIIVPLGLSFISFQIIGYLVDVWKGKIQAERNLGIFALFIAYFPKMSAGPIETGAHLLPQLRNPAPLRAAAVVSGIQLFVFGLVKKIVIADNLAIVVDRTFGSLDEFKGLSLVLLMILYAWQIYADFSGYTDMARGVSRMFGIELFENFRQPYFSSSVREFWRRWHISLSSWLKEYLYIPLGGSRKGWWRTALNTMIVFVLCGLWHGASWNFVIWGALHGVYLVVERATTALLQAVRIKIPFSNVLGVPLTFGLVAVSWVFFRAQNLTDALYILRYAPTGIKNIINPSYVWATVQRMFEMNHLEMGLVAWCLVLAVGLDVISSSSHLKLRFRKLPVVVKLAVYIGVVCTVLLMRNVGPTEFVYVQF